MLVKRIPVAAGLGGGSADAAAALVALSRLWDLHLTEARMHEIGAVLGSDVPFFLQSKGTAFATGRGERIEPLDPAPSGWVIVSVPDVKRPEPKTASMYGKLDPALFTDGQATDRWSRVLAGGATSWSLLTGEAGFTNVFESIATNAYPGWKAALETFQTVARGAAVSMTGTGPALFAVFDDRLGSLFPEESDSSKWDASSNDGRVCAHESLPRHLLDLPNDGSLSMRVEVGFALLKAKHRVR